MSEWHEHRQFRKERFPCNRDDLVVIEFRNGKQHPASPARHWRWWLHPGQTKPGDWDIVRWRKA